MRIIRFGDVWLEYYNQVERIGRGAAVPAVSVLPGGGVFDHHGSNRIEMGASEISKNFRLTALSQAALDTAVLQLTAYRGERERLFRRLADGTYNWIYARLLDPDGELSYQLAQYKRLQDLELRFLLLEASWRGLEHGAGWLLDDGYYLDDGLRLDDGDISTLEAGPNAIVINNGGLYPARDAQITITAGDADITALTIEKTGVELGYSGTIAAGDVLVIDCGAASVVNNGVDAYADFALGSGHASRYWLSLEAGVNYITLTMTGGGTGSTAQFGFNDRWP